MKRNDLKQNLLYKLQKKKYCQRKYVIISLSNKDKGLGAPDIIVVHVDDRLYYYYIKLFEAESHHCTSTYSRLRLKGYWVTIKSEKWNNCVIKIV